MKSKVIILLCIIVFVMTIVIPAIRFFNQRSNMLRESKTGRTISLSEEIEEVKKMSSGSARNLGVESFDPNSEYDRVFVAARMRDTKRVAQIRAYDDMSARYARATTGPAAKRFITAEKLIARGDLEKAAAVLVQALKDEPANDIMKLKIYQKLGMIFMITQNESQYLKALLKYIELCERLDSNPTTRNTLASLKMEVQKKLATSK